MTDAIEKIRSLMAEAREDAGLETGSTARLEMAVYRALPALLDAAEALKSAPPHGGRCVNGCCNPACGGQWGTGCYCCHHGSYHPALARLDDVVDEEKTDG